MSNPAQLLLLADHIKLSLLERQRAISLNLEPNSHDAEISRSLASLNDGIERLESSATSDSAPEVLRLRQQYNDLYAQFTGNQPPSSNSTKPNDPALARDFSNAQERPPQNTSSVPKRSASTANKSVRFTDSPSGTPTEEDPSRAALFPYKDDPDDGPPDHSNLDNQQIHAYHSQVIREQDEQLDRLGQSVGRQRELSIQIGDELDDQVQMLGDVDEHVTRHQTQLDKARGRLGNIARKAKDNMQLTIIFILIIILVLLIIILK